MRDVSGPEKYPRNLSIGQSIKAIGSLSGALVAVITIAGRWQGVDWQILFKIYTAILLLTVVLVALTRISERRDETAGSASFASCLSLLSNPFVLMMVLGIFVYVGAEVCISSGVNLYLGSEATGGSSLTDWLKGHLGVAVDTKTVGPLANALFFILLFVGRSSGSVVLNWISAAKLLVATVLLCIVGLLGLLLVHDQTAALVSVVLAGIGCANIFPLIFSITVNRMPERTNEISGLMVTAIVGGAVSAPLDGFRRRPDLGHHGVSRAAGVRGVLVVCRVGFPETARGQGKNHLKIDAHANRPRPTRRDDLGRRGNQVRFLGDSGQPGDRPARRPAEQRPRSGLVPGDDRGRIFAGPRRAGREARGHQLRLSGPGGLRGGDHRRPGQSARLPRRRAAGTDARSEVRPAGLPRTTTATCSPMARPSPACCRR